MKHFPGATHAQLLRFATAVDIVMNADGISPRDRCNLIGYWPYLYGSPTMLDDLNEAIKRCQSEPVHPTATSVVDAVTGEVLAYNPG